MSNLNLCPTPVDIYIQQGDIEPFTFTIRGSDWTIVDITGLNFEMYIWATPGGAGGHDHEAVTVEAPEIVVGTVTDATGGVVEFALSSLQADAEVGSYYYEIISIDVLVERTIIQGNITFVEDICGCMPPTQVEICNMALSFLGNAAVVQSVNPPDPSTEAMLCAQFYPIALSTVLEMHSWSFATNTVALTAHECDRDAWDYCYMIPHDFLKVLAVLPTGASDDHKDAQEYSIEQDTDGVLRLFTDQDEAVLRYTMHVQFTRMFPSTFVLALAWHLASLLAGPIIKGKQGSDESKRCLQTMAYYMGKSTTSDSLDRRIIQDPTPTYLRDR
jgi:hypothetical protein